MSASCAPAASVFASCASAITSPSADSPAALFARRIGAVVEPITRAAIGAAKTLYSAISAVRSGAFATSCVTMWLFTEIAADDVLRRATDLEVDVGDQPPLRSGSGHDLAVDHAVDGPVRVAGDDDVDLVVHRRDDRGQGARRVDAAVDRLLPGRRTGAVTGRETLPPSWSRTMIVSTFCFFSSATAAFAVSASAEEIDRADARRRDDRRRRHRRHADDPDLDAVEVMDGVRREDRVAAVLVGHVRREEVERRPAVGVAVAAAVHRMAAVAPS